VVRLDIKATALMWLYCSLYIWWFSLGESKIVVLGNKVIG